MGYFYNEIGDPNEAKKYYLEVAPIYEKLLDPNSSRLSGVYVNTGIQFDILGDLDRSIEYYLKANEIDKITGGEDFWLLAYNYSNIAIAYSQLDNDSITQWYLEKSIEIANKNNIFDVKSNSIVTLGNLFEKQGQVDRALALYKESEQIVKKELGLNHPRIYESHLPIAKLLVKEGKHDEAISYLKKAVNAIEEGYGSVHPWLVSTYRVMAEAYKKQLRFNEALEAIEKGVTFASREHPSLLTEKYPLNNIVSPVGLRDILLEKGRIYESMSRGSTKKIELLKKALDTYKEADFLMNRLRRGLSEDGSKILLQDAAVTMYGEAIGVCFELYQLSKDQAYLKTAFTYSEKNKAIVLAETLKAGNLEHLQGIPDEVFASEKSLKQKIRKAEKALNKNPKDSLQAEKVFHLKRSYDSLTHYLANNYPKYFDLKHNLEVATLEEVQTLLKPQQAALSYFKADSNWYIFSITKNAIILNEISTEKLNSDDLQHFRSIVSSPNSDFFSEAQVAYNLYKYLIEIPLSEVLSVKEIIIAPDGILGYLPFDALVSKPIQKGEMPHYFIEDYAIAYTSSLTMFSKNLISDFTPKLNYVGFAPDYPTNVTEATPSLSAYRDVLSQLSGTKEEVIYAAELLDGKSFLGEKATESNFKSLNKSTSIMHLAMHAVVDEENPMQSKLLFTQNTDFIEDGQLNAYEIYDLEISSKLAVLSACNTGYGKVSRGEGIMSLSRAFLYAGCPSIVMSLWRAKDKPTATIMANFFESIKDKAPKHQALRQAKLAYLAEADPLQRHPSNWATFVILGNTNPINQPTFLVSYLYVFFALILCVISIIAYLRKKKLRTVFKEA